LAKRQVTDLTQVTILYYPQGDSEELLRLAAARYTGMDTAGWKICREEKGKPFFPEYPHIHFSISHSGDFWACAFSGEPVGFDLQIKEPRDFEGIAKRFFCPEEIRVLAEKNHCTDAFYPMWTAKESYVKFLGRGINGKLNDFDVTKPLPDGAQVQPVACPEGYCACLCTPGECAVHIIQ